MGVSRRRRQFRNGGTRQKIAFAIDKLIAIVDGDRVDGKHRPEREGLEPKEVSIQKDGSIRYTF